ncbi:MAG: rhomboid family intramembrane serine protease [Verrucomicrobia bacterium]|nr:MAG: rhomboid family intramembrane serine protease [Verrucomicrobiota bacterium]
MNPGQGNPADKVADGLPEWAAIRARSRREAMDWSLVLASQGIAPVIRFDRERGWWVLVVRRSEFEPAVAAIRQYLRENRGWHWPRSVVESPLKFHWGVLVWAWGLVLFHWWSWASSGGLEAVGTMNHRVWETGQWWRFWTATTLHADVGHLAANASTGIVVLGLAMGIYGAGWAWLGATLAGVFGNVCGALIRRDPYMGLGASGVVMGALGMLAVYRLVLERPPKGSRRRLWAGLAAGLFLFILLGANPESDMIAHTGGFVGGVAAGWIAGRLPASWRAGRGNTLAGWATGLSLLGAWLWALGG